MVNIFGDPTNTAMLISGDHGSALWERVWGRNGEVGRCGAGYLNRCHDDYPGCMMLSVSSRLFLVVHAMVCM